MVYERERGSATARRTSISIEWTEEQKQLIGQISDELTGAVIGVVTDKDRLANEYGGATDSDADRALVEVLYEVNRELGPRLGADDVQPADVQGLVALALAW